MSDAATNVDASAGTAALSETDRVALAPGVMKRLEKARDVWTLQGPERVLVLDEMALAVVNAAVVTPPRSIAEAIDALAAEFSAPRDDIAGDVLDLLTDMRDRGFLSVRA